MQISPDMLYSLFERKSFIVEPNSKIHLTQHKRTNQHYFQYHYKYSHTSKIFKVDYPVSLSSDQLLLLLKRCFLVICLTHFSTKKQIFLSISTTLLFLLYFVFSSFLYYFKSITMFKIYYVLLFPTSIFYTATRSPLLSFTIHSLLKEIFYIPDLTYSIFKSRA